MTVGAKRALAGLALAAALLAAPARADVWVEPGGGNATGEVMEYSTGGTPQGAHAVDTGHPLPTVGSGGTVSANVTRPANTTTYTANTAWAPNASGSTPQYGTLTGVCRTNGGTVYVPDIHILDYANQTLKLTGILWLFNAAPTSVLNDDGAFNVASGDWSAELIPVTFTLSNVLNAGSGASGAVDVDVPVGVAVSCGASANLYFMIEVTDAYVPISAEILTVALKALGLN
jgi:hypothetical protein